jgi:8-oxo-dGTP diphosphatase
MKFSAVPVAVGVLTDAQGRFLVARRALGKPWGGYWEFPGGKREPGETRWQALVRELHEELGIEARQGVPLIRLMAEPGPASAVLLDVWQVASYEGKPVGREGQALSWVAANELDALAMPPANRVIRRACHLPDRYLITPPDPMPLSALAAGLQQAVHRGIRLIQIRRPGAVPDELAALADLLRPMRESHGLIALLNDSPEQALAWGYDGVHLTGQRLASFPGKPAGLSWVAASCHNPGDLARATALEVDFAVLSPVRSTPGHANVPPLGWRTWARWVRDARLPVYALGGMQVADLNTVRRLGGQGVAAIRGLWPSYG